MIVSRRLHFVLPAVVLLLPVFSGCGKKGPPVVPLRPVPEPVADLVARRMDSDVYLRMTIPTRNVGGTAPADIERLEIYGYTGVPVDELGKPLDDRQFRKLATLVGRIEIQPPPEPESEEEQTTSAKSAAPRPQQTQPEDRRPSQGMTIGLVEKLDDASLVPVTPPGRGKLKKEEATATTVGRGPIVAPLVSPVAEPPLTRFYEAVGISRRGDVGPRSPRIQVPLVDPPAVPSIPEIAYGENTITIGWTTPAGAKRHVQDTAEGEQLPARTILVTQLQPSSYNVYEVKQEPQNNEQPLIPKPLNASPLAAPPFQTSYDVYDVEHCYVVRTVDTVEKLQIESRPSPAACVTPKDTFPPVAPKGLSTVGSEGSVSLIWEPNSDKDLAGYLVLRGEAPGEKLQTLVQTPIRETTFRDTSVRPGVRYVYAIVAVDNATPANQSLESNRVEEAAK